MIGFHLQTNMTSKKHRIHLRTHIFSYPKNIVGLLLVIRVLYSFTQFDCFGACLICSYVLHNTGGRVQFVCSLF